MILHSLSPEGRRLVTPEFVSAEGEPWPEAAWLPLVTDASNPLSLDDFDALCDEAVAKFPRFDSRIDGWLASRLRRALPLSRREAADPGVWRFLGVVQRPDFVRHRWENLSWATMRDRFWSPGTRHTSNAFMRLWWIAEITREGNDYSLADRLLARASLTTQIFVRSWSVHRPAVGACVDTLSEAPAETVERSARELSRHLGAVPLEGLSRADLKRLVGRFAGKSE